MAIDRAATLRNAEKLIRQGKLDAAIAEYLRVVEDQPGDWNTANTLGDLYARAGQIDKAIEQFVADRRQPQRRRRRREGRRASTRRSSSSSPTTSTRWCRSSEILGSQGLLRRRARRT